MLLIELVINTYLSVKIANNNSSEPNEYLFKLKSEFEATMDWKILFIGILCGLGTASAQESLASSIFSGKNLTFTDLLIMHHQIPSSISTGKNENVIVY